MQKKNEEYLATRTFCHLDKPILLSKELDISLVNIPSVNYSMEYEFNYPNHKVSDDLGLKNLYIYKNINSEFQKIYLEIKKAFNNTKKKNYSIKDITKKIIGQSITSKNLKSMYEFEDFILSNNIVVVYKEEYYVKTTYEGRKVTLPDEKRKTQVVNYINFINFLLPYNSAFNMQNFSSDYLKKFMTDFAYFHTSNFTVIEDERKMKVNNYGNWFSRYVLSCYKHQSKKSCNIKEKLEYDNSNYFLKNKNEIIRISELIENLISTPNRRDVFIYISNIVSLAGTCNDDMISLVLYTSVIESLLTHSPYNVEDSISKQFCLKICIVLERCEKEIDLELWKEKCRLIYSLRSNIAHGNTNNKEIIKSFKRIFCQSKEKEEITIEYNEIVEVLLNELWWITKKVIYAYILNSSYIEFIKDN